MITIPERLTTIVEGQTIQCLTRVKIMLLLSSSHNMITVLNTLRPRQDGRHFPDDIFKCIFLNENVKISIKISLRFVPKGPINIIPSLVQIMAWRRPGDKPLSEPMMVRLLRHICITRPQWVKQPKYWNCKLSQQLSMSTRKSLTFSLSLQTISKHYCYQFGRFGPLKKHSTYHDWLP